MKFIQQVARIDWLRGAIGDAHPVFRGVAVRFRDVLSHIADFVHLATLHEGGVTGVIPDRCADRFAAVHDV